MPQFYHLWNYVNYKNMTKGLSCSSQLIIITYYIIEKAREFQKNIYFCFIDCAKAFDCVDHKELWKILKEFQGIQGIPDHLTCLLRNLYAGQEPVCNS